MAKEILNPNPPALNLRPFADFRQKWQKTISFRKWSSLSPVAGARLGGVKKTTGATVKHAINDSGRNIQVEINR